MKYAEILFQQKVGKEKDTLTYAIPPKLGIKIGQNVLVKIKNREIAGIVFSIHSTIPPFITKNIIKAINPKPLLNGKQINILKWMTEYYFCCPSILLKLFIPKKILEGRTIKTKTTKDEQINITPLHKLTKEQETAFKQIISSKENKFLIQGVTGSGKTEIYTHLAKHYIDQKKQVLILVPEISLTPQTIKYFESKLNIKASVIHSKKSEGEKNLAWTQIWENKSKLIIGSRSAIFTPIQNPGLIIIDEEHEYSYKQENNPRYKTHRIAEKILEENPQTKLVYASATPSIETMEKTKKSTLYINERIGKTKLPKIKIIDLREEFKKQNHSIFSEELKIAIHTTIKNNNQAILFINRRGSASSVVCRDCGQTIKCDTCEMPMTYHKKTLTKEKLICHHCGKISNPPTICPICKSPNIRYLGIGTQKIEEDLKKEFPQIKTLRADKDTTNRKNDFENIYNSFKNHEADVLIGTQMIAKGLHLPNVDLVGIILADIGLNIPDFRTAEKNFQLLTQISGRAGRGQAPGQVIIQTYNPENISLKTASEYNFTEFLNYERTQRSLLKNPPFGEIAKLIIQDKSETKAKSKTELLSTILNELNTTKEYEINCYPAYLYKLKNTYRNIILIKSSDKKNEIHKLLKKIPKEYIIDPNIKIDIDPITTT